MDVLTLSLISLLPALFGVELFDSDTGLTSFARRLSRRAFSWASLSASCLAFCRASSTALEALSAASLAAATSRALASAALAISSSSFCFSAAALSRISFRAASWASTLCRSAVSAVSFFLASSSVNPEPLLLLTPEELVCLRAVPENARVVLRAFILRTLCDRKMEGCI